MKQRLFKKCFVTTAVLTLMTATHVFAHPTVYPTGTTIYDPTKAYNSYVLFGAPDGKTHLIDMDGNEVHSWDRIGFPSEMIDPAITNGAKGHVLVQQSHTAKPANFSFIFANETIAEQDWSGDIVWQWGKQAPGGAARENHDWDRLANGDTLLLSTVDRVIPELSSKSVSDQVIREINPQGDIVWSWYVGDHLSEFGFTKEGMALLRKIFSNGDVSHGFLTINDMQPIGANKWYDNGDKRFDPNNIVIDSREGSFIAIVDKNTGHIVWRMGPDYHDSIAADAGAATFSSNVDLRPSLRRDVPRPMDQTSGQHDAHIIPKGLPGAGDLLVFDNESPSGFPPTTIGVHNGSRVLEINPVTRQIVWQYNALDSGFPLWTFSSSFISSASRLPNGNTLIDEGMNGRFFQVTPQGEIVWEYVNPYFAKDVMDGSTVITNWSYRAQAVPYDWVPAGTPRQELALKPVDNSTFRIPTAK